MPAFTRQDETFGQSDLETVVGIFRKLVGRIADERQVFDLTHDEQEGTSERVQGPFIATGPLSVYCEGRVPPTN